MRWAPVVVLLLAGCVGTPSPDAPRGHPLGPACTSLEIDSGNVTLDRGTFTLTLGSRYNADGAYLPFELEKGTTRMRVNLTWSADFPQSERLATAIEPPQGGEVVVAEGPSPLQYQVERGQVREPMHVKVEMPRHSLTGLGTVELADQRVHIQLEQLACTR